ncbi:MAG: epoxyqueuosine reductase QueH, partial [Lachnospiraceae bacterium]|nr:epoxyqueuosine reductase QueH [Lachnospiraceae bacterium]
MNKINYQKELEQVILGLGEEKVPGLLLHSCCAPCSSYVLEYLAEHFAITVFYYNPNIAPEEEYRKRVEEQKRLIGQLPVKNPIGFAEGNYEPGEFYEA